jgi:putative addiction module CopG family antidote
MARRCGKASRIHHRSGFLDDPIEFQESLPMGMHIHLTPELEQLVQEQVSSGRYRSTSEVVGAALKYWDERDRSGNRSQEVPKIGSDQIGSPLDTKDIKPKGRRLAA